jgi:serine/threonine protein kinase
MESGTSPSAQGRSPAPLAEQFGRYRIIKPLGKGGMGTVYLAQDSQLDRRVALKVPHFSPDDGPDVKERFFREARAAATIEHPNICPVYDVGEMNGIHYLTMAYIEGRSLADLLRSGKPLPERQVAVLVRKLALALAEAHGRGIVHRDLKPSNIMINQRGEPVIMDFGLARQLNQEDSRLTQQGALLGTPAYMPPEQVNGEVEALGPNCDIYSLGVILYELLSGQVPFKGTVASILAKVLTEEPRPLSAHRPDVNPALEAVCHKAMAKSPADRHASMRQLASALYDCLHEEEPAPRASPPLPDPVPVSSAPKGTVKRRTAVTLPPGPRETLREAPEPGQRPHKRHPKGGKQTGTAVGVWVAVGAGSALVVLAAVGLVLLSLSRGKTESTTAVAPDVPPRDTAGPPRGPVPPKEAGKPPPSEEIPAGWQRFSPAGAGCSVLMPGTPQYEQLPAKPKAGERVISRYTFQSGDQRFVVAYVDYPGSGPQGKQIEETLDSEREGLLKDPNAGLLRETKLVLEGYPGREWEIEKTQGRTLLKFRCFVVGRRLFLCFVDTPLVRSRESEIDTFLTSFQLTH